MYVVVAAQRRPAPRRGGRGEGRPARGRPSSRLLPLPSRPLFASSMASALTQCARATWCPGPAAAGPPWPSPSRRLWAVVGDEDLVAATFAAAALLLCICCYCCSCMCCYCCCCICWCCCCICWCCCICCSCCLPVCVQRQMLHLLLLPCRLRSPAAPPPPPFPVSSFNKQR